VTALRPLDLLAALVLEDGTLWGQRAEAFQRKDAAAILDNRDVRRHYLLRGRGMSKTTDTAALVLVLLLTDAPARSRSHAYAADGEQAAIMLDTIRGLAERSGLLPLLDFTTRTMTVKRTGATLTVESADGASAFGLRPWLTVVDELGVWPNGANHQNLWSAIVSAVPKVPGSRLVVIGTAGSPTGIGAEAWTSAEQSPHWHTSRHPGPAPWWDVDDMIEVQDSLTASQYRRLILCEWAEGDDALTNPDDVAACIRPGSTVLPPVRGVEYVAALDVGTRRDLTALVVGHAERREAGRVVVVDRVLSWKPGGKDQRIDLSEVETAALRLCREYRVSRLRFDRMQAEQMTTNLARAGVRCDEFVFSTAGANRLARTLWGALRDHALDLPDDDETRAEFLATRLVETGPGVVKLQNPPGTHDDIVTAVGMLAVDLAAQPDHGGGSISTPTGHIGPRATVTTREAIRRPAPGSALAGHLARDRAKRMPRGLPGGAIVGVPGAHDDPRRRAP
jgi:hypothetical protein